MRTIKERIKHFFFFSVGVILFGAFVYLNGVQGIRQYGKLQIIPFGGALLATIGITGSIAYRWGILSNAIGGKKVASWIEYYHYFIISRTLGFILPKDITDLISRSVWLKRSHGLTMHQSGTTVIFDRLFDTLTAFVFLLAVLPFWLGWVNAACSLGLLIGFALVIGILFYYVNTQVFSILSLSINTCFRYIYRLPPFRKRSAKLLTISNLNPDVVLHAYFVSLTKFCFTAGRLILFAITLNIPISPLLILLGTPLGQLTYLFAFTPGGLGIFEAGWFGILKFGNVSTENAMAFVVGQRILTIVLIGILALLSQIIFMVRRYRLAN